MPKPIATEVNLSAEEQEGLEQLVRRHNCKIRSIPHSDSGVYRTAIPW